MRAGGGNSKKVEVWLGKKRNEGRQNMGISQRREMNKVEDLKCFRSTVQRDGHCEKRDEV